jgi:HAD superfamily hydrolase (TIGR01490 family)
MDHTLVDCDCDVSWKQFLVSKGVVQPSVMDPVQAFFDDYNRGELDVDKFILFQLEEFKGEKLIDIQALSKEHFEQIVKKQIYPKVPALIEKILKTGRPVSLLTATNRIIAEPLAAYLGVPEILSTEIEVVDEICTGRMSGVYCGGENKLPRALEFCKRHKLSISDVAYYGDSISDRFVLDAVGFPFPTNPSSELEAYAKEKNWECIDFT